MVEHLGMPLVHYESQLDEVLDHLVELDRRAETAFTIVSAIGQRALLSRSDETRRAAIIVTFVTGALGTVGLFATLAAIPPSAGREIRVLDRSLAIAIVLLLAAATTGWVLAALSKQKHRERVDETPALGLATSSPALRSLFVTAAVAAGLGAVTASLFLIVVGGISLLAGIAIVAFRGDFD